MAKLKQNEQTLIYKTLHRKLKIEQQDWKVSMSCSISETRRVTF